MNGDKMSDLQSKAFLNKLFHFCATGSPSSTTNWTKSQSNCQTTHSKENHANDMCEPNKNNVKTGIWTNISRVEISSRVHQGNTFYNNNRIYLFIPQSLYLQCTMYYTNNFFLSSFV